VSSRPQTNRTASARERRAALLRAATEIAAESGVGAATHRSVAARAGLPSATPSYFFASLTDLMAEALRSFVQERTEQYAALTATMAGEATIDELGAAFSRLLLAGDRVHELAQIEAYLHAARGEALRPAVAEAMAAFEAAAEAGLRAAGAARPDEGARAFVALVDGFVLQHLANPRPDDEEELRHALRSLFLAYALDAAALEEWSGRLGPRPVVELDR
jgi:DNA-binding transcriptional regulator YbjK